MTTKNKFSENGFNASIGDNMLGEVKTKHYLNSLDELIKQGNELNNELDKCLNLQEQTIKEIQRTNKILDALNFA